MKNTIIAIVIVAVVAFTVGLYVGDVYGNGSSLSAKISPEEKGDYKNTFDDGWRAAKEKLEKSGFLMGMNMGERKTIFGDVASVDSKKIVMNTNLLNPLDDDSLKTRNINLTNDTKITLYKLRTQAEQEEAKKNASGDLAKLKLRKSNLDDQMSDCQPAMPAMPGDETRDNSECMKVNEEYNKINMEIMQLEMGMIDNYKEVENAKLSDIEEGYTINVTSAEDTTNKKDITATAIDVREVAKMVMPTMPSTPAETAMPENPAAPVVPETPIE